MHHTRRFALAALAAAALAATASAVVDAGPPRPDPTTRGFVDGDRAVQRLGDRLPQVAAEYGLEPVELRQMLLTDDTIAVDGELALAYFDLPEPGLAEAEPSPATAPAAAPPTTGPEFQLASLPGADKTIYLDFDGHVTEGTTWNSQYGLATIVSPPYDLDGSPDSWSSTELQRIANVWAAVAEDFAPWNVNVTTIEPSVDDLRRSGIGDTRWGARVVITDDTFAGCGCGGHAYIGAFDDSVDEPTFVYNSTFTGVAEAASHEVGHMMLLFHDGTSSASYYAGHDAAGSPGWAPIMGAGYSRAVTQWSRQEYTGANNTGEDDIAIISSLTNGNGFGVKADDHGDTAGTATGLVTEVVDVDGTISTRDDVDVFTFTTPNGADVSFSVDVAPIRANLDVELTLRDGDGDVVVSDNEGEALDASITATVPPGTYTVEVDGVGAGDPSQTPPSGYSDYGSLGRYTLLGSISDVAPPDTDPPGAPAGFDAVESDGSALLTWDANTEPDLAGYVVQRDLGGGFTDLVTLGAVVEHVDPSPSVESADYRLIAVDTSGNRSTPTGAVTVTFPLGLTRVAIADAAVDGTVTGSYVATHARGGASQTITEQNTGGKPRQRVDRAEHRWTLRASDGNQTLTVVATSSDGGDADDGFSIEWSNDGDVWVPLATVRAGGPVDADFDIGAPSGDVYVRIVDTNRTGGQQGNDSVTIDFLQLTGDAAVVEPPTPAAAVASLRISRQAITKREQAGVATVAVHDDLGAPIAGAAVTVVFSGDLDETVSATTDTSGIAVLTTTTSTRRPVFSACVADVTDTGGLPYLAGGERC